ncbi:MAG: RecQ family ATP-dependent DNA helicase [Verrucomicrobiota bacterium JB025]|nr:RecQ family ATP-dependent DNA helicase [Verrucomicrobiota bacterium JB025]
MREDDVRAVLRERFGFDRFRGGQEAVIGALLEGRPALAVFPTGGGKSLCYQLPAMMLKGLTLVVSPLIALMKDQVDALVARGIAAARLDSTLEAEEVSGLYERLDAGEVKLLYVAPERLANERFRKQLSGWCLAMVAIDEAHCISEWGHNFRPDYLKLAEFCRKARVKRVLALTATATPKVAAEIRRRFRIAKGDHVQLSFHRENLELRVTPVTMAERKRVLLERVVAVDGAAVVYVTRQETAEEVATFLQREGVEARAYHAGLRADVRADAQREFMAGEVRVVVATIAFGMGIDKADIRAVFHYNLPKSLENYTQEIGRAGRDGDAAVCEMLACGNDLTVLENFVYADTPTRRALGNLLDRVLRRGGTFDVSVYDLAGTCDVRNTVVETVLAYLETDGVLESTGSFHQKYRVRLLRTREQVVAGMAARERKFVASVLERGKEGRYWTELEPVVVAEELGVKREKVVAVAGALEAAGDAVVKVSGVRKGFRLKREVEDLAGLVERYCELFERREEADLQRLGGVLGISSCRGCLTNYLTRHFGEKLDGPCGHCDRCRGVKGKVVRRPAARAVSDDELRVVRELAEARHAALGSARQLARFLCGMTSPASTRARLTRHDAFGLLGDVPFEEVLAVAEVVV